MANLVSKLVPMPSEHEAQWPKFAEAFRAATQFIHEFGIWGTRVCSTYTPINPEWPLGEHGWDLYIGIKKHRPDHDALVLEWCKRFPGTEVRPDMDQSEDWQKHATTILFWRP